MSILTLPNVIVDKEKYANVEKVHSVLTPVVQRLATLYPLWKFEVAQKNSMGGEVATAFTVSLDGERLGSFGTTYTRSGTAIEIHNDRIAGARSRKGSYTTRDADKAVVKAKKMFGKMNQSERLTKALTEAERVVTKGAWNKERERTAHQHAISDAAHKFIMGEGFQLFMQYVQVDMPIADRHKLLIHLEKKEAVDIDMLTIERVQKEFTGAKTALVIKDAGKYLVKIGDKISLYDDNTFPHDMRMKLGMLKLVENEQYVSDMGCRVSDEIFVLLVDET